MLDDAFVPSEWQQTREALLEQFRHGNMPLGELLRRMREAKGWTRHQQARLYGYYVRAKPMSPETIEHMELTNQIPKNLKRRYILASLLDIPVAYLGLATLEEFAQARQGSHTVATTPSWISKLGNIDLVECHRALKFYWQQAQALSASAFHSEILFPVSHLYHNVLYADGKQHQEMMRLLCYYQQLLARIAADCGAYRTAMEHMNKAYKLAKLLGQQELQALVLIRRAYVSYESRAFAAAISDFDAALCLQAALSSQLKGVVLLSAGDGHAQIALSSQEMTQALQWIEQAEPLVGAGDVEEEGHFLQFDAVRYHMDYAYALMGSPLKQLRHPESCLEHLSWVRKYISLEREGSNINSELLKAKAWLDKGYYPDVTKLARKTLLVVREHELAGERARIEALYQRLKDTNYGKSVEVAQLGMDLMLARYPEVFS
ncbi:MAG: helix-turn-helix transcriptional regulator [Ktedonobacteraceae bacterium]|nr:helix-turn-helix transcriptional regulator [Ktedonobacteraceae bacterium]